MLSMRKSWLKPFVVYALGMLNLVQCIGKMNAAEQLTQATDNPSNNTSTAAIPLPPFVPSGAATVMPKIKQLLTKKPVIDSDITAYDGTKNSLRFLIHQWMNQPEFEVEMQAVMKLTLQQEEAPDLGDMFTPTAVRIIQENRPFTEIVTTKSFWLTPRQLMTLALRDGDQPYNNDNVSTDLTWPGARMTTTPLVDKNRSFVVGDPDFMIFYSPNLAQAIVNKHQTCADGMLMRKPNKVFQYFIQGKVEWIQDSIFCQLGHEASPFNTIEDNTPKWVTIEQVPNNMPTTPFWDVAILRTTSAIQLRKERVGFFANPSFLTKWSTNNSNSFRVVANQTLIVALNEAIDFTNKTRSIHATDAIDSAHANNASCYACHSTLDPLRSIFLQQWDVDGFNLQNQKSLQNIPAELAFWGKQAPLHSLQELGEQLASHPLFPLAWVQKMCVWANGASCNKDDPEVQRIAHVFVESNFQFKTMLTELLLSPLVTGQERTSSYLLEPAPPRILTRNVFCRSLQQKLSLDFNPCDQPADGASPVKSLRGMIPENDILRGQVLPTLPLLGDMYSYGAMEALCRSLAHHLVYETNAPFFSPDGATNSFGKMVEILIGVPKNDSRYTLLYQTLLEHYKLASDPEGPALNRTDATKSVFVAACMSASAISIGL